jgi:predicted deacylase
MTEDVVVREGRMPGPVSVVLAGIHGNEICGVQAFERILPSLSIERGRVFFCLGNPRSIAQNVRFTEANLNRLFKPEELLSAAERRSYEYGRAQFLKTYLDQAEVLLDIHASRNTHSMRFVICEESGYALASALPVERVVSGFDDVQPGGTDYYMNREGKVGICVECGFLGDPHSAHVAEESLHAFLAARGHIKGETRSTAQQRLAVRSMYITKTGPFTLERPFRDFENVARNEVIGYDGGVPVCADEDGFILFAGFRAGAGEEAFLLGQKKEA